MYRDPNQREFARKLRNEMTPAERALWQALRADQLRGLRFRRQAAIGPYFVDFACFSAKLVIELDGPQHQTDDAKEYDAQRTSWLSSQGFRLVRFQNHELDDGLALVVVRITRALDESALAAVLPSPQPSPPGGGSRKDHGLPGATASTINK